MTFRTKAAGLGALIAVLSLTLILGLTTSFGGNVRSKEAPLLASIKTGNLKEIRFKQKGEERFLKKGSGQDWDLLIKGKPFPTAEGKVKRFLEILAEGKLVELVTDKEANWKTFEVGDDAEKRILLAGDQGKAEILVGKAANIGSSEYVRIAGDKRVYRLSTGLGYYVEQKISSWCDLRIFPKALEGKQIVAVSVKGLSTKPEPPERLNYGLIREKDDQGVLRWLFPAEKAVKLKQSAAEGLANALAQATGTDFVPDPLQEDTGLGLPDLVVEFTTQDQKGYKLLFGKKAPAKQWYCTASVDGNPHPYTYLMSEYAYERIALSRANLLESETAEKSKK